MVILSLMQHIEKLGQRDFYHCVVSQLFLRKCSAVLVPSHMCKLCMLCALMLALNCALIGMLQNKTKIFSRFDLLTEV